MILHLKSIWSKQILLFCLVYFMSASPQKGSELERLRPGSPDALTNEFMDRLGKQLETEVSKNFDQYLMLQGKGSRIVNHEQIKTKWINELRAELLPSFRPKAKQTFIRLYQVTNQDTSQEKSQKEKDKIQNQVEKRLLKEWKNHAKRGVQKWLDQQQDLSYLEKRPDKPRLDKRQPFLSSLTHRKLKKQIQAFILRSAENAFREAFSSTMKLNQRLMTLIAAKLKSTAIAPAHKASLSNILKMGDLMEKFKAQMDAPGPTRVVKDTLTPKRSTKGNSRGPFGLIVKALAGA